MEVQQTVVPNTQNPTADRRYLQMYVVTGPDTKDYPGKYVVRRHVCKPGLVEIDRDPQGVVDTLREARMLVPQQLSRQPPMAGDDPVIVEVWF